MSKEKRYLLLISFLFGVVFNFGNPAIPLYAEKWNIRPSVIGIVLASSGIGLFLFSTIWGAIGDIKDRNKIIGITFGGFALGQCLFGIAHTELLVILASMVSGLFAAGVLVNIYSYINDNFLDHVEHKKTLSYAVSLTLLGASFGYLLGGFVSGRVGNAYGMIFIIQAILSLIVGVYIYFEQTDLIDTDHHLTRRHFYLNMAYIAKLPWLPVSTITLTFFISFSHNNIKRYFDYYFIDTQHSPSILGVLVFVVGIVSFITSLFLAPRVLKHHHQIVILQTLFLFVPLFVFLTFYGDHALYKYFSYLIVYYFLMAIYEPTAISLMSSNKDVPQGILVGVRQSIVGLGMTLGFLLGGVLYEINKLYVFYFAVIFYIIVFVGFTIIRIFLKEEISHNKGGIQNG